MKTTNRSLLLALCLLLLSIIALPLTAQRQWNVWYFGNYCGVDFNSGVPVALSQSQMVQKEGCASIADRHTGDLLFYTDGVNVWNRKHKKMYTGWGLGGNNSTTQSALIVPVPGKDSSYYIFTVGPAIYSLEHDPTIYYAVVDMTLNNGDGEVVSRNVMLGEGMDEKLTAVRHADGCGFWVIGHGENDNRFVAWPVSVGGMGHPVVSYSGENVWSAGHMKSSVDGTRLAVASSVTKGQRELIGGQPATQVFRFDPETGRVYDPIALDIQSVYGIAFSPDESKLYATHIGPSNANWDSLSQFDLTLNTSTDINASKILIGVETNPDSIGYVDSIPFFSALQLGPDRKIYVARGATRWLGVINNPNAKGTACGYMSQGVRLASKSWVRLGLPNIIDSDLFGTQPVCAETGGTHHLLEQNQPNPVNGMTTIRFTLGSPSHAVLSLHDVSGRELRTILNEFVPYTDENMVEFDASELASGVYYYRLTVGAWSDMRPLVVVR